MDHRREVLASTQCGCFHCLQRFVPQAIQEWTDDRGQGGTTALCPHCGYDAVIGSASGYPVTREFLARMSDEWF